MLTVQIISVGEQIAMQRSGHGKGQLDGLVVLYRGEFQLRYLSALLSAISPGAPYGASARLRVTMTQTGKPGRMLSVGCRLRLRCTICCPV